MVSITYPALIELRKKFNQFKEIRARSERDLYIKAISLDIHQTLWKLADVAKATLEWTGAEPVSITLPESTVDKIEEVYEWFKAK